MGEKLLPYESHASVATSIQLGVEALRLSAVPLQISFPPRSVNQEHRNTRNTGIPEKR